MPKLSNYEDTVQDAEVEYELWEDNNGEWQARLKLSATGEDAVDVANKIAQAMRIVYKERPDHSKRCVCLLCTEWKVHNTKERLE